MILLGISTDVSKSFSLSIPPAVSLEMVFFKYSFNGFLRYFCWDSSKISFENHSENVPLLEIFLVIPSAVSLRMKFFKSSPMILSDISAEISQTILFFGNHLENVPLLKILLAVEFHQRFLQTFLYEKR